MKLGEHEAELRWFYSQAAGELGLHSNFAAIVARLEGGDGGRGTAHHIDTRRLEAAARARGVAAALGRLSRPERDVLVAAYSMDPDGRLLWVMHLTDEAKAEHRTSRSTRSRLDWLRRLCLAVKSPQEFERRRTFARIHSAADKRLQGALDAYAYARRLLGARAG